MNIIHGDCIEKMRSLKNGSVNLVYLDPPFFSQRDHALEPRDESKKYGFPDTWESLDSYLRFMGACLIECRRLICDTGSIFLHCDRAASHHLRILLDSVFQPKMFQSEIIWAYRRWSNTKKGLLNAHQTIYFYSKTEAFKFNSTFTDYAPSTNVDQILQRRTRDERGKSAYDRDESGEIVIGPEKHGVPLSDVWQIPYLNPKAKERCGYPTQKPLLLLERIVSIVTDEGDRILDPFCGSGTTLVAARRLKREAIGIDISSDAVNLANERLKTLVKTRSALMELGDDAYRQKTDFELAILQSIDAVPVQRNSGIDGFLRAHMDGRPIPIKIQKHSETLADARNKLLSAASAKKCEKMVLIRTDERISDLFGDEHFRDERILTIDAYDLVIEAWLERLPHADIK